MRRIIPLGGLAVVGMLAATALVLAHDRPEESLANGAGSALALQALIATALGAVAVLVWIERAAPAAGALFLASGIAFDAKALPVPDAGGPLLFTLALVLGGAAAVFAGAGVLALGGRVARVDWAIAGAAVLVCTMWTGLLPATLFDPSATGCFRCPTNLVLAHGDPGLRAEIRHSGLRAAAVVSIALAVVLLRHLALRGAARLSSAAMKVGGATALIASAWASWHEATSAAASIDRTTRLAWVVECAALGLVAAGPAGEFARARVQSARIVETVLRTVPSANELLSALAKSAGDPSLALVFPRDGGDPVDGDGLPAGPAADGTATTDVVRYGQIVAQLRHGELTAHATRRLFDAVRAAGLALEHASSRARLRAALADLTASRARIVEVADAERRRLERNLHDGAQQRLIALSLSLGSRSRRAAAGDARAQVLAALDELRAIAHGIHPASLSDGGIVASVRELADTSQVPLRLELRPVDRLPPRLEAAAYRVVADCVRAAERLGRRPRRRGRAHHDRRRTRGRDPPPGCRRRRGDHAPARPRSGGCGRRELTSRATGNDVTLWSSGSDADRDRRGHGADARGPRAPARRPGLRRRRAVRGRRDAAAPGRARATRCRDRRHQAAADAHRRGPSRRGGDPRQLSGHLGAAALELPRRALRRRPLRELSRPAPGTC